MIRTIPGIILILWGFCQIYTLIKYDYNEHKKLNEWYGNKEPKE